MNYSFKDDLSFTFKIIGSMPERAWSNILANNTFGYIATDAGTGHMWHYNSRENRINRWLNDPLAIKGTERLEWQYNGRRVSLFAADDGYECVVTYGFGYARWDKYIDGKRFSVVSFVPIDTSARVFVIETECKEGEILYYTDLVLGHDEAEGPYIVTEYRDGVMSARNAANIEFPNDPFYVSASQPPVGYTCNKMSWISKNADSATGEGMLPCVGMIFPIKKQMIIAVGCDSREGVIDLCNSKNAKDKLLQTLDWWKKAVSPVQIETPDPDLDKYFNGWALYQVIACRLMARCSVYQCGGAYGFRDQLQDVCALIYSQPDIVKNQIVLAAKHQFEEGDVQHWWHPSSNGDNPDKGVRTRCSDDLLWLAYTLCSYVEATGDKELCNLPVEYIKAPPLDRNETERYCYPEKSGISEPLVSHCIKAAELVISRGTGIHGLCLFGNGDWNDGMNSVGTEGKGESVWLTWFAVIVFEKLAVLCRAIGNSSEATRLDSFSKLYRNAANDAWDGQWFLRGWFDSGEPLGSSKSQECQIDSIAQSFSVFAGGDPVKVKTALEASYNMLFDRENRVIRLFTPAFDNGAESPGYIRGYSPGFRENGGQYTHGAVWLAKAFIESGKPELGYEILNAILPATHDIKIYKAEPYVLAGDVSYNSENIGLAGWSWYTGAAGWYYRTVLSMLGICIRDGKLYIEPKLPKTWTGYTATFRDNDELIKICVDGEKIYINGEVYNNNGIQLKINN